MSLGTRHVITDLLQSPTTIPLLILILTLDIQIDTRLYTDRGCIQGLDWTEQN